MVKNIYDNLFLIFDYTRNGIFFAPIFIVLGYKLSKLYNKKKKSRGWNKYLIFFIVFFILSGVEAFTLKKYNIPRHDSMTIFLVPAVFFLFRLCLQLKNKSMKNLRDISLYIYILHPMMIVLARVIGKITKTSNIIINNSLINYFVVTLLSILISVVLINIKRKKLKNY